MTHTTKKLQVAERGVLAAATAPRLRCGVHRPATAAPALPSGAPCVYTSHCVPEVPLPPTETLQQGIRGKAGLVSCLQIYIVGGRRELRQQLAGGRHRRTGAAACAFARNSSDLSDYLSPWPRESATRPSRHSAATTRRDIAACPGALRKPVQSCRHDN